MPQRTLDALLDEQRLHPLPLDVQLDVTVARRDPTWKLPRTLVRVFRDACSHTDGGNVPALTIHPTSHRPIVA